METEKLVSGILYDGVYCSRLVEALKGNMEASAACLGSGERDEEISGACVRHNRVPKIDGDRAVAFGGQELWRDFVRLSGVSKTKSTETENDLSRCIVGLS